jgi:hypothetical protein
MPYHLNMKGVCISFAVHDHRANAEFFRSADDTTRNFPSRAT